MTTMRAVVFIAAAFAALVGVRMVAQSASTPLNNIYLSILLEQGFELRAVSEVATSDLFLQKGSMLYRCSGKNSNYTQPCARIGAPR